MTQTADDYPTCTALVEGIQRNDALAVTAFYNQFSRGLKWVAYRRGLVESEAEDVVQECIFVIVRQIQAGALKEPETLHGYARVIVVRECQLRMLKAKRTESIEPHLVVQKHKSFRDSRLNPEQRVLAEEKSAFLRKALSYLKPVDVEILRRFYLLEQSEEHIRAEMDLTETQFRLNKSRAKKKLEEVSELLRQGKTPRAPKRAA